MGKLSLNLIQFGLHEFNQYQCTVIREEHEHHNLNLSFRLPFSFYPTRKMLNFHFFFILKDGINHGINGNVSLNRHGELSSPQHRYDLSMSSDKSSSLSRSEGGVYDVVQAENCVNRNHQENNGNVVNNNDSCPMNGHTSLDSREGRDSIKRRVSNHLV